MQGRVLILDDDTAVGETIGFVAEAAGMDARAVSSPADFFREVDEWQPTHIVLDLIMPEMDGVEIMRHLAARRVDAGIIILSGVGSRVLDAARRAASEKGLHILGVLSKPISPSALQAYLAVPEGAERDTDVANAKPEDYEIREQELLRGIENREFKLFYQPKILCATGKPAGFEALARWLHPERGLIGPDRFIPLAEQHGLIEPITQQIMDEAIDWLSQPDPAGGMSLSVNLSARTMTDIEFADRLAGRCRDAGIDPDRLILELTETAAMDDPELALDLVTRLRMKGFHVSIDDVGTGYSSIAQLARLPFSEMKVDKSFVMTADSSPESRTIISSIVELGHNLELRVVAEGVEDSNTLDFLRSIGCDYAQGFFIAHPMNAEHVAEWMSQRQ